MSAPTAGTTRCTRRRPRRCRHGSGWRSPAGTTASGRSGCGSRRLPTLRTGSRRRSGCAAARARHNYAVIVRAYLSPAIGQVPLAKLGPEHVRRMLADLTARGDLSPTTVRYCYSILRIALGRALKEGKVLRNVATLVDPPAAARHELEPLSAEQVGTFLAATAADRLGPLYTVAVGTGLRQGELLGLRWEDVDLDGATLAVVHTLSRGSRTLAEPKTDRARRTLRLGSEVLAALREQRRRQLEERLAAGPRWREQGYVFTTPRGAPLDGAFVLRTFQRALGAAGLPKQRFHDVRHATATLLLE